MGTNVILTTLLVLQLTVAVFSMTNYRVVYGGTGYPYYSSNYVVSPDRTYYTNPYTQYRYASSPYGCTGYSCTYSNYPNRVAYSSYPSRATYPDDNVYITDKYGQTTAVSRANYASSGYSRAGYARGLAYKNTDTAVSTYSSVCGSATCGQNAQCSIVGGRPVCSCFRGYTGDPLHICTRAECLENSECRGHLACRNERCVNPCDEVCGSNAQCDTRNHVPICSCPPGHTGDPFSHCRRFDPAELCHPSPCGRNTQCEVVNSVPTCKCLPGYHGSPISGCQHECENDAECGPQLACLEFKCQNPCSQCGTNADCEVVRNHIPVCKCPRGYFGNPLVSCQPECTQHSDCPPGKPACFYNSCKNPCDGVCGVNANCETRNGITPVCSCPKEMTGDPFVSCRPFTKEDLCIPNPCGTNANCDPGYDKTNKERPVCTCPPGYTGDPLRNCIRGECVNDGECPDSQSCVDYRCQNPCIGQCGTNAMCNARRHIAVCTCLPGYNGDALSHCYAVQSQSAPRARCLFC